MHFLVNCPFGLSSILSNELKYLGLKPYDSFETGTYVQGDYQNMMQINIWSRIANKVYLHLTTGPCIDFDTLFALIQTINWDNYINPGQNIVVNVHAKNSQLDSNRAIQAICNKAIYKKLLPNGTWPMDPKKESVDVFVMIINNQVSVFVNSSGTPLHQRGYRTSTGEAPLKENLAAALVILSNWKYSSPFWDPFCGSGTLGIEAAMLARNIAPGLNRNFAFQTWKDVDSNIFDEIKNQAKQKQYSDKKYQILLSDNDEKVLEIAKKNASNAGVLDTINFEKHDFLSPMMPYDLAPMAIVTNPPYGKRLTSNDLEKIYTHLINTIQNSLCGGFITSYKDYNHLITTNRRQKRLFNGADECVFYSK